MAFDAEKKRQKREKQGGALAKDTIWKKDMKPSQRGQGTEGRKIRWQKGNSPLRLLSSAEKKHFWVNGRAESNGGEKRETRR